MKITLIVEGKTEKAFLPYLRKFLEIRLQNNKPRDAVRILSKNDLAVAINACPELKSFVNTIIKVCGGVIVP
jgi:hypothetical protein